MGRSFLAHLPTGSGPLLWMGCPNPWRQAAEEVGLISWWSFFAPLALALAHWLDDDSAMLRFFSLRWVVLLSHR